MHLVDRATNVLERILLEPKLQKGPIILIGHSFGGLVIKQLLRTAESMSYQHIEAAGFLKRIRRVVFLATPHLGAAGATWADRLRIFVKPSAATDCLVRNDRNLYDLNLWYRDWSARHSITHQIFMENQPIRIAGFVVKPDSGDPGLSQHPITIDANHFTICKPKDRSSEIYLHICGFVKPPFETQTGNTTENNSRVEHIISSLNQTILGQTEKTTDLVTDGILAGIRSEPSLYKKYPKNLVDSEIQKNLLLIRRARFFSEFSTNDHSIRLAEKIRSGEFHGGSDDVKSNALAWCARFLALGENNLKSDEFLNLAKQLGNGPEVTIAEAFRISSHKDLEGALGILAGITSSTSYSAALRIVANQRDATTAITWLSKAGLTYADLDADGKVFFVVISLELCN